MVEERRQAAQKTFPEQPYCPSSCRAWSLNRRGEKEGIQNGASQVKEIPQVPRQGISYYETASAEITMM
ncbi:hypothetical protein ES703_63876 [subsurface metagenome]